MKGIVFNLLEEVVSAEYGDQKWDALLEAAGVAGAYSSIGTYPDEELGRIVAAASRSLGAPPQDVVRWFGRKAIPLLARNYPQFFSPHRRTVDFLLTLNTIIHPEVRKLHRDAVVPDFRFETPAPNVLQIGYQSPRRLCALAEGFIQGAADYYGETLALEHPTCMLRGDDRCVLIARFAVARRAA